MFKKLSIIILCLSIIIFFYCTRNPYDPADEQLPPARALTAGETELVTAGNNFGYDIFKEIVAEQMDANVFISPLSIAMALGMTLNGADSSTKTAMQTTLQLTGMSDQEINENYQSLIALLAGLDPQVVFTIANSIWFRQGFTVEPAFIDVNRRYFNALVQGLNFNDPAAIATINNWVNRNTNGRIKEIIKEIDPLTVMFLINAIYFKGTWTYEFKKANTHADLFTRPDGAQVPCHLMKQENDFLYAQTADLQLIDLPYGNGRYSMTVLLPAPGISVDAVIAQMSSAQLAEWLGQLEKTGGTLELPKFKLEWELELKPVLSRMGMAIAFSPGEANFHRINPFEDLFIQYVKHKTFVQVDEEGTEAAAVTIVAIGRTSVGGGGFIMRVDRPFVFLIRDHHAHTVLFMGKIVQPGN